MLSLALPPVMFGTNLKRLGYTASLLGLPFFLLAICEIAVSLASVPWRSDLVTTFAIVAIVGACGYCSLRWWGRSKVRLGRAAG